MTSVLGGGLGVNPSGDHARIDKVRVADHAVCVLVTQTLF